MGSISRCAALDRYITKHGDEKLKEYSHLIGKTVVQLLSTEVDYYVKGYVKLDDGTELETHYRWASAEEDDCGTEMEEDYVPMAEYYEKHIVGKTIKEIQIGYERDDDLCIYAYVDDKYALEIPLGVDPECGIDENGDLIE